MRIGASKQGSSDGVSDGYVVPPIGMGFPIVAFGNVALFRELVLDPLGIYALASELLKSIL